MFGLNFAFCRAKRFKTFRKSLNDDYKMNRKHIHKNPHAIPLNTKLQLLSKGKDGDWGKLNELERNSYTPFGRFVRSKFIFDKSRLPFFDIPDLTGFQLKPYVSFLTPKFDKNKIPSPLMNLDKTNENK